LRPRGRSLLDLLGRDVEHVVLEHRRRPAIEPEAPDRLPRRWEARCGPPGLTWSLAEMPFSVAGSSGTTRWSYHFDEYGAGRGAE
jgi:hypothetical protein